MTDSSLTPDSQSTPSAQTPKSGRRWLRIVIGILVVILLVVAFLPRIGASWMRSDIQSKLSEETGLEVSVGSLSAGWFSSVAVGDLKVSVPSGGRVLAIDQITTQKGLLGLMTRDKEVGEVYIDRPSITVDMSSTMRDELKAAFAQMDPTKGILKVLADPEKDALVNIKVSQGSLQVKTESDSQWQSVTDNLTLALDIDREGQDAQLGVFVPPSPITVSPVLSDYGLQFIAPVLSRALALQGNCSIAIDHCHISPNNLQDMKLDGSLTLHNVNADVDGPVIQKLTGALASLSEGPASDQPPTLNLQVIDESKVVFTVQDGIVHHEGFAFGLPKLLKSFVLTTGGDVGFDKSLDLKVKAAIPFDRMGEAELLKQLGSPSFTVPIAGTLEEPQVDVGQGKMVGRFVQELVMNATDQKIDPAPLLKQLTESGLLSNLGKKDDANADADTADEPSGLGGAVLDGLIKRLGQRKTDDGSDAAEDDPDSDTAEEKRGGILQRLRDRRRNKQKE